MRPSSPDPPGHRVDVGVHRFAQGRHLIDETDLRGQERVGRVLDQFGALQTGHHHGRLDKVERPVQLAQDLLRPLRLDADDHPVRPHEIRQCRAFAQKLGVGGHIKIGFGIFFHDDALDVARGADRHRGFVHYHRVAPQPGREFPHCLVHVFEIGMAVPRAGTACRPQ